MEKNNYNNIEKSFEALGVDINSSPLFAEKEIIDFSGKTRKVKIDLSSGIEFKDKGHLNNILQRDNLPISKTGKEIKEKLVNILREEEQEKNSHLMKITTLITQINSIPTEKPDSWLYQGLPVDSDKLPKMYSYKVIYPQKSTDTISELSLGARSSIVTPEATPLSPTDQELAQKYNRCVEDYINCLREVSYITTFMNNLKDSDKYDLSIDQATAFGF
jgi:hypothetical protein